MDLRDKGATALAAWATTVCTRSRRHTKSPRRTLPISEMIAAESVTSAHRRIYRNNRLQGGRWPRRGRGEGDFVDGRVTECSRWGLIKTAIRVLGFNLFEGRLSPSHCGTPETGTATRSRRPGHSLKYETLHLFLE
jgi:hypothetical protein